MALFLLLALVGVGAVLILPLLMVGLLVGLVLRLTVRLVLLPVRLAIAGVGLAIGLVGLAIGFAAAAVGSLITVVVFGTIMVPPLLVLGFVVCAVWLLVRLLSPRPLTRPAA